MNQTLCSLSSVLNSCQRPNWISTSRIALVVNSPAVSFRALRDLEQFGIHATLSNEKSQSQFEDDEDHNLGPNDSFTLNLPRNISENVVVLNLVALLEVDSAVTTRWPAAYFLVEEEETGQSFCYTAGSSLESAPTPVTRYHQAIELWNAIKGCADIESNDALFLFGDHRTRINPGFRITDLATPIAVEGVKAFVDDADRKKARQDIFRSVLSEFLRHQKAEGAFAHLLRNSEEFTQGLSEGWQIYLKDYTPERMKQRAVVKHLELTEKLEKIIGGMEAKSLTIPAAVLLAVKEVHFGAGWTTLNLVILTATVLYLLAMMVAHFSQRSTLKLLKTTIGKTTDALDQQGLDVNSPVLGYSFVHLESRRKYSACGSWAMFLFSFIPLVAVIYAAFFASPPPPKPAAQTATSIATHDVSVALPQAPRRNRGKLF